MKSAEISVDGEYAYKMGPSSWATTHRVRVLAVGVEYKKKLARSWDKAHTNGIKIVVLDTDSGEVEQVRARALLRDYSQPEDAMTEHILVARPQEILSTWAEELERDASAEKSRAEGKERKEAQEMLTASLYDRFERVGLRFGYRHGRTTIELSTEDAGHILDQIEKLQRRAHVTATAAARPNDGLCNCKENREPHPRLGLCGSSDRRL